MTKCRFFLLERSESSAIENLLLSAIEMIFRSATASQRWILLSGYCYFNQNLIDSVIFLDLPPSLAYPISEIESSKNNLKACAETFRNMPRLLNKALGIFEPFRVTSIDSSVGSDLFSYILMKYLPVILIMGCAYEARLSRCKLRCKGPRWPEIPGPHAPGFTFMLIAILRWSI